MQQHPKYKNFYYVDHPLILNKLTQMREKHVEAFGFRTLLREISMLIGYEITRDMEVADRPIETPVAPMNAPSLVGQQPCIVPILRAGLGMSDGLLDLIPTAQVGHLGVYRNEETKKPVEYLHKLPKNKGQWFFIVDPMLATGNSLAYCCDLLIKHGIAPDKIRAMCLVAAPEGLEIFFGKHPDIKVYCAALDEKLNDKAYIVPGLGDAGDRMFGTND